MAKKPITAGRKSIIVTTMVPKACVKMKLKDFMLQLHSKSSMNFAIGYLATTAGEHFVAIRAQNREGLFEKI